MEKSGLNALREVLRQTADTNIDIPEVYEVSEKLLQLEKIDSVAGDSQHFEKLAKGLAAIHSIKQECYGFQEDNYIGLNPQKNILMQDWGVFFLENRLRFQITLIANQNIRREFEAVLLKVEKNLVNFLNQHCEYPSLVHGDLWQGNVLFSEEHSVDDKATVKKVWLIDPAVYYGDREVDIAMTEMFGGFSAVFYQWYQQCLPLSKAYETKKIIYNLYHYLNHYNLFGSSYLSSCESALVFLEKEFS